MNPANVPPWGCPWHGKVQGGQLQLPNGTSLAWPQPDGTASGTIPDQAGYTFRQKLPGVPDVVRTAEELAADEAAGKEWRNTFIVGGTDTAALAGLLQWPQIHGKRVCGWIYSAPGGGRWLIKGSGTFGFSQGGTLTIPLTVLRFGDFGAAFAAHFLNITATSAAMGQLTPSVSSTAIKAKVEDISPAGDKAIVMLYIGNKTPIGFLLLTLSGTPGVDFVASVTTLKTRSQTLGAVTISNGVTATKMLAYHDFTTTVNDQRGAYPSCGYVETIHTPTAVLREPLPGESSNVMVGNGENRITVAGRIMAMWFDDAGIPQPLTLDSEQVYSLSAPVPVNSVSGRVVGRRNWSASGGACVEGPNAYTEYMSYSMSQTASESAVQTVTLSYLGSTSVVEHKHERTVSHSASYTGTSSVQVLPAIASSGIRTGGRTITVDGVVTLTISEDSTSAPHTHAGPFVDYPPAFLLPIDNVPRPTNMTLSASNPDTWVPAIKRWANNLVGLRTQIDGVAVVIAPALSPLGVIAPTSTTATGQYGSLNPVTGAAAFPSATPVSWT